MGDWNKECLDSQLLGLTWFMNDDSFPLRILLSSDGGVSVGIASDNCASIFLIPCTRARIPNVESWRAPFGFFGEFWGARPKPGGETGAKRPQLAFRGNGGRVLYMLYKGLFFLSITRRLRRSMGAKEHFGSM
jgi:hypothetical protein